MAPTSGACSGGEIGGHDDRRTLPGDRWPRRPDQWPRATAELGGAAAGCIDLASGRMRAAAMGHSCWWTDGAVEAGGKGTPRAAGQRRRRPMARDEAGLVVPPLGPGAAGECDGGQGPAAPAKAGRHLRASPDSWPRASGRPTEHGGRWPGIRRAAQQPGQSSHPGGKSHHHHPPAISPAAVFPAVRANHASDPRCTARSASWRPMFSGRGAAGGTDRDRCVSSSTLGPGQPYARADSRGLRFDTARVVVDGLIAHGTGGAAEHPRPAASPPRSKPQGVPVAAGIIQAGPAKRAVWWWERARLPPRSGAAGKGLTRSVHTWPSREALLPHLESALSRARPGYPRRLVRRWTPTEESGRDTRERSNDPAPSTARRRRPNALSGRHRVALDDVRLWRARTHPPRRNRRVVNVDRSMTSCPARRLLGQAQGG